MPKITTEDCRKALIAAWPDKFGSDRENWKRVSKVGKRGEPIARIFHHGDLPLQAYVWEKNGAISGVEFKGLAPWHFGDLDEYQKYNERWYRQGTDEFVIEHELFKPQDFVFHAYTEPDEDDATKVMIAPVAFFQREGHCVCDHFEPLIGRYLPDGYREDEEACFSTPDSVSEARVKMLSRGFVEDPKFSELFDSTNENGEEEDDNE